MTSPEYNAMMDRLDKVWNIRHHKMDWLAMEQMLVDILASMDFDAPTKVSLCKDCIDAYTKRGHFR